MSPDDLPKCAACPTAGRCGAQLARNRWACAKAPAGDKSFANWLAIAGGSSCPEPKPADPPPAAAPAPRLPLAVAHAVQRRGYQKCPEAEAPKCGCSGVHCRRLGRPVDMFDCASCLGIYKGPRP